MKNRDINDVNEFLFVSQRPIDFVIVSSTKVNHDVFVAKEKHRRATVWWISKYGWIRIVELLERVEKMDVRMGKARNATKLTNADRKSVV